ncbi:erlin-2-like, partial [Acipenser oxyrinchus oxyrinchus]
FFLQAVRVTKPNIPESIRRNYELILSSLSSLSLLLSSPLSLLLLPPSIPPSLCTEAEKLAQVAEIKFAQQVMEKQTERKISEIEDSAYLAKEKARADAEFYTALRTADANRMKLTPAYLQLMKYKAISTNSKIYFGSEIPRMFVDSAPGGLRTTAVDGTGEGGPQSHS